MTSPDDYEVLATAALVRHLRDGSAQEVRHGAGLGLGQVARAVGVTPATIWRWEHLKRTPRGAAAVRYFELLRKLEGAVA